jgi:hypothetical protein
MSGGETPDCANSKRRVWLPLFGKSHWERNTLGQLKIKVLWPCGHCDIIAPVGKNYTGKAVSAGVRMGEKGMDWMPQKRINRCAKKLKTDFVPRHLPKINRGSAGLVRFLEKTGQGKHWFK